MNAGTPLSVREVAALFGISTATVNRRVADGTFPIRPHLEGPSRARRFPAGVVHFYLHWNRLPESPAELAQHLEHLPLEESA